MLKQGGKRRKKREGVNPLNLNSLMVTRRELPHRWSVKGNAKDKFLEMAKKVDQEMKLKRKLESGVKV